MRGEGAENGWDHYAPTSPQEGWIGRWVGIQQRLQCSRSGARIGFEARCCIELLVQQSRAEQSRAKLLVLSSAVREGLGLVLSLLEERESCPALPPLKSLRPRRRDDTVNV